MRTYTRKNVVNVSSDKALPRRTSTSDYCVCLKITEPVILQTNNCAINYTIVKYAAFYTFNCVFRT